MGTVEHRAHLIDMHCHLGFVSDVEAALPCLAESDIRALSCTVDSAEYERDSKAFAGIAACTVALGLHPWHVAADADSASALARFEDLAPTTRFIGEVGLDFAGERDEPAARELQKKAFDRVLAACDAPSPFPRKLISIHAVKAADNVLDALGAHDAFTRHDCIFHWFSGTSEELKRAIDAGCFFSVGPRMLATKRGHEYARVIPAEQLLLETDSPSAPDEPWSCMEWKTSLAEALTAIAELKGAPEEELARLIAHTSERLLTPA